MSDYPEHDKLAKISTKSQSIGEFLDWLPSIGVYLAEWQENHPDDCLDAVDDWCGHEEILWPSRWTIQNLLARYFDIDRDKLEDEKQAMLTEIRRQQGFEDSLPRR